MTQPQANPEIELPLEEYMLGVHDRVNHGIEEYLEGEEPDFRPMFEHALDGEAPKRLRPALAYITGDTLGAPREDIDELALAVELIHSASLVMDDLPGQDNNSDMRRGQIVLHERFGVGQAELTALAMAFRALKMVTNTDIKHNLRGQLSSLLIDLVGPEGMSLGQLRDIDSAGKASEETTEEELDVTNWLKTGTAVKMSAVGAAIIASPPDADVIVPLLDSYSYHMGIAHQVEDDLWDGTKTPEEIGKPTGIDVRNNNPTYFSVLGEAASHKKAARHAGVALATLDSLPEHYNPVKLREIAGYIIKK